MTTPTRDEAVRQKFEAWAKSKDLDLTRAQTGGYLWPSVQYSFSAYQAALRSPAVAGLVEACQKVVAALDGRVHSRDALAAVDASRAALAQYATLAGEKA